MGKVFLVAAILDMVYQLIVHRGVYTLVLCSGVGVTVAYRLAWERYKMQGDALPRASAIQELVTAWRVLWTWRRRA